MTDEQLVDPDEPVVLDDPEEDADNDESDADVAPVED